MTMDSVFNWGDPVIGVHRTYQSTNIRPGVPWHNTQQFQNAEVDAVMDKAGKELDRDKRAALYGEMQKLVVDEAPIAYLHTSPYHTVFNHDRVGNPPVDFHLGRLLAVGRGLYQVAGRAPGRRSLKPPRRRDLRPRHRIPDRHCPATLLRCCAAAGRRRLQFHPPVAGAGRHRRHACRGKAAAPARR